MQKYFNKKKFYNETNGFQLGNKLKAYFKDPTNKQKHKLFLENRLIKCGLLKKHRTIATFIEATNNENNEEISHIKPPK